MKKTFIILLIAIHLFSCSKNVSDFNKLSVSYSSEELTNMKYNNAKEIIQACGFNNIELEEKDNASSYWEEGNIIKLTIDGKSKFDKGDSFNENSVVKIKYSTRKHDDFTFEEIEYDVCFHWNRRSDEVYYAFDLNSNKCLEMWHNSIHGWNYRVCTYELVDNEYPKIITINKNYDEELMWYQDSKELRTPEGPFRMIYEEKSVSNFISSLKIRINNHEIKRIDN